LFDVPSANATDFYAGVHEDRETKDEEDTEADPNAKVEGIVMGGTATMTKKRISNRTTGYTPKENVCLCRSWLRISQDSIFGVEQKGRAYWSRVNVIPTSASNLNPSRFIVTVANFPFKRDGPSSNLRPTSFVAP
jgi:hypothetical protein